MAKFELKFLSDGCDLWNVSTIEEDGCILITINTPENTTTIGLDKSTAIKFAKTLRTEINKITEQEVEDGLL
jgi:hypothetical protein